MILYVTEQGAKIQHVAGRIVVRRDDHIIQEVPDFKLKQIIVFGNNMMTSGAIDYCFEQGIDVAFLSTTGRYKGRLEPPFSRNAALRRRQYERISNPDFCRANAAAIVVGKIRNMIAMVRRQRRLRDEGRSPVGEMEAILPKAAAAGNLDSLNGFEGTSTAAYFRAFRAALKSDWEFEARQYHPPSDPVNALLSFGYTLLYNDVYVAINIAGLDAGLGVLHRPRPGHHSLASDLMEEHRAALVDRLVLTALNKRILIETDFILTPELKIRLAPAALKRFLELYGRQLGEMHFYPAQTIRTTYRRILEEQARHFARVVLGEEPVYQSFSAELSFNADPQS